ncbi:MAG: hypothetical protein EXR69_08660, partial [Myxococcales bacterium]|nr:hypothetical protein [Myxococcales bacterium]
MNAETTRMFGSGPASVSTLLTAAVLGFGLLPQSGKPGAVWLTAAAGGAAVLGAQPMLSVLPASAVPAAALALLTLSTWAAAPLLACQSLALNPLSGVLLLLGAATGRTLDSALAVPLALALGGLAQAQQAVRTPAVAVPGSTSLVNIGARTLIFAILVLAIGLAWSLLRGPLLPAEASLMAVLGGVVAGLSCPGGRWVRGVGVLLGAGGAAALAVFGFGLDENMAGLALRLVFVAPRLGEGEIPALVIFLGVGCSGGLLLRGIAARPREQAIGSLVGALLLPAVLPLMSTGAAVGAGSSLVSVGSDLGLRTRLNSQRARLPLQHAQVTASGATLIRGKKGQLLAELDGSVVDPDSRAVEGERFAGTLGACLVADRSSARVAGDDL